MEGASTAPSFASSEVISNWHWLLAIWIFHVLITDGVTVHKIHGSVQFTVLWLWFLVQFGIRWSLGKSNSLCLVKLKEWGSVKSDASLWQSEVKKRWDSGNARKKTLPNKWKAVGKDVGIGKYIYLEQMLLWLYQSLRLNHSESSQNVAPLTTQVEHCPEKNIVGILRKQLKQFIIFFHDIIIFQKLVTCVALCTMC